MPGPAGIIIRGLSMAAPVMRAAAKATKVASRGSKARVRSRTRGDSKQRATGRREKADVLNKSDFARAVKPTRTRRGGKATTRNMRSTPAGQANKAMDARISNMNRVQSSRSSAVPATRASATRQSAVNQSKAVVGRANTAARAFDREAALRKPGRNATDRLIGASRRRSN